MSNKIKRQSKFTVRRKPKKKKKLIAHHIFLIVQCFPFMNNLPNNVIEDYYFIPRGNNRVHILTTQKLAIARNGGVRG